MTETLTIKADNYYISQIILLLNSLPSNKIEIIHKSKIKKNAFGILKGCIKNPVLWQQKLREESDRDLYCEILK